MSRECLLSPMAFMLFSARRRLSSTLKKYSCLTDCTCLGEGLAWMGLLLFQRMKDSHMGPLWALTLPHEGPTQGHSSGQITSNDPTNAVKEKLH